MRDSDPRPMPPAVKAAYKQPVNLLGVLSSEAYSGDDRMRIRDELLEALVRDFGDVHFPHGSKQTRTTTQRAKAFKDPVRSVGFILSVEDYGGRERLLPYLARTMEPRWQTWWSSMNWRTWGGVSRWSAASYHVLSPRQFAWLAAQYARDVVDVALDRVIALRAIEAAEAWAANPTEMHRKLARDAADAVVYRTANSASVSYNSLGASNAADSAANTAANAADASTYATYAASAVANATESDGPSSLSVGYARLCELTKQMITPSLLDAR